MADIHISEFYKDVANILLRLYRHFPRKTILYVEDITGEDEPDEFGLHSERFLAGFSAMVWLGDQNFLQYDATIKQEALDQAALSERGFLMLSSRSTAPNNTAENKFDTDLSASLLEETHSNVALLRNALRSGSSISIKHCVHTMLMDNHCRTQQWDSGKR
ncbi:MAG: hypothetical protein JKY66_02990 [Spongiibacteraceae bacterium]|nr:hypothetical protein [Spongiibacteraceae bacterium]